MMEFNKIYNMDCVAGMQMLPDNSIDLTVTSPPYDNLRTYNGFTWDFEATARELYRITKQGGVVVWIVADATIKGSETGSSFKQALFFKDCGFNLHDTMIWEKPTFTATGSLSVRYAPVFEYMFVLSKGKPKAFHPIKDKPNITAGSKFGGTVRNRDGSMKLMSNIGKRVATYGQRHNVWRIGACNSKKDRNGHPAPFPKQLVIDHIISWSNEDDIVLDPFMGSGTTAVACVKLNRRYIGFEISSQYIDIAKARLKSEASL
jgi:site-specific DNA-methyltransferase (adenine-specific)